MTQAETCFSSLHVCVNIHRWVSIKHPDGKQPISLLRFCEHQLCHEPARVCMFYKLEFQCSGSHHMNQSVKYLILSETQEEILWCLAATVTQITSNNKWTAFILCLYPKSLQWASHAPIHRLEKHAIRLGLTTDRRLQLLPLVPLLPQLILITTTTAPTSTTTPTTKDCRYDEARWWKSYNLLLRCLWAHFLVSFWSSPAFSLSPSLSTCRSQFGSTAFTKVYFSAFFRSPISLNLNGFCHTVTRSLCAPEGNHGWPWLHGARRSTLQQVPSNKQCAPRVMIIPVKNSINNHSAIHLINDFLSFHIEQQLRFKRRQTVSLKWRNVIWADRCLSWLLEDRWDGQIKKDNVKQKQTRQYNMENDFKKTC